MFLLVLSQCPLFAVLLQHIHHRFHLFLQWKLEHVKVLNQKLPMKKLNVVCCLVSVQVATNQQNQVYRNP